MHRCTKCSCRGDLAIVVSGIGSPLAKKQFVISDTLLYHLKCGGAMDFRLSCKGLEYIPNLGKDTVTSIG